MLITLNEELLEIKRPVRNFSSEFVTRRAHQYAHDSLVFFGSRVQPFGERLRSDVSKINLNLQKREKIALEKEGLLDGGTIRAAVPTMKNAEYIIVRPLSFAESIINSKRIDKHPQREAIVTIVDFKSQG